MQSSLFEPRRPVIFTCSTGDRVDGTIKGPSEKRDQFAVLEYMKGGQMVTHPCAPLPRIEFRHLQVVSMCNCSAWCMIARRVAKPNIGRLRIFHCLCQGVNLRFSCSQRFLMGAFTHSVRTAPIITVIIQVTTLKTTHLRNHAQSIQNSKIQTSDACHGSQGPTFCPL